MALGSRRSEATVTETPVTVVGQRTRAQLISSQDTEALRGGERILKTVLGKLDGDMQQKMHTVHTF